MVNMKYRLSQIRQRWLLRYYGIYYPSKFAYVWNSKHIVAYDGGDITWQEIDY